MKKRTPKVAVVSNSEAYWSSAGKIKRAITTAKNPDTMESYHSSALPITASATWSGFGANGVDDIASP
jgi:2-methylaconitate cis-trans-isomerase PrpF